MKELVLSISSGVIGGLIVLLFQKYWDYNEKKQTEANIVRARDKDEELNKIIDPEKNAKYVDSNIANSLLPGTSILKMKDILGVPQSSNYGMIFSYNGENRATNHYYYNMLNAEILITSFDGLSITSITIQSSLLESHPMKLINPFNEHLTGYLGDVTVTDDMLSACVDSSSSVTVRDYHFGIEQYFGQIGKYNYFTSFGADLEKIQDYENDGEVSIFCDCVIYGFCISSTEKFAPYIGS